MECRHIIKALFFLFFLFSSSKAIASGFQSNVNFGVDSPTDGDRVNANFAQGKLATLTKFFRLESSFVLLSGSGFLEGEGGIGVAIYPVSQFVSERANIHPFLFGMGTVGVGKLNNKSRLNAGAAYGVGVDLKFWKTGGLSLSLARHDALEKSFRYSVGIFWLRAD